jgi:hypothetical protein
MYAVPGEKRIQALRKILPWKPFRTVAILTLVETGWSKETGSDFAVFLSLFRVSLLSTPSRVSNMSTPVTGVSGRRKRTPMGMFRKSKVVQKSGNIKWMEWF